MEEISFMVENPNPFNFPQTHNDGYQHNQSVVRNSASPPVYDHSAAFRPAHNNFTSPMIGLPGRQNAQAPVAHMYNGQRRAQSPTLRNSASPPIANRNEVVLGMSNFDPNVMAAMAAQYNNSQMQGVLTQAGQTAMMIRNRGSDSQSPVEFTQQGQSQALNQTQNAFRHAVMSQSYNPNKLDNGTLGPNNANPNHQNNLQAITGHPQRSQTASPNSNTNLMAPQDRPDISRPRRQTASPGVTGDATIGAMGPPGIPNRPHTSSGQAHVHNQRMATQFAAMQIHNQIRRSQTSSPAFNAQPRSSVMGPPDLPNRPQSSSGHSQIPHPRMGGKSAPMQMPHHLRHPRVPPTNSQATQSRTTTPSPINDNTGYALTPRDRERLYQRLLLQNNITTTHINIPLSSIPRPSAPLTDTYPPSVLGKHPLLDAEYAPPSKKPFFAPPAIASAEGRCERAGGKQDPRQRRLSLKAQKHGAGHLSLSETGTDGRVGVLDPTDAMRASHGETTKAYAEVLRGIRLRAQAERKRVEAEGGRAVGRGRERGDSGVGVDTASAMFPPRSRSFDELADSSLAENPMRQHALLHGVRMAQVETGNLIKRTAEATGTEGGQFGRSASASASLTTGASAVDAPEPTTHVSSRTGVRALPSSSPPPSNLLWATPVRDADGALRAPEPQTCGGATEEHADVLYAFKAFEEAGSKVWVLGDDGEWMREGDARNDEVDLDLHRWADAWPGVLVAEGYTIEW
ncbi:hypothetical protein K458DRAFT_20718 [Lentithecium fluviatile CBS 122367]|uniref:Uncharacterized protein n=1 Tax=Lentithecium fluviatile CBS 122367 TaxID=1168545 RepID=A0A6G1J401_9PLEO|nr:hypothetical protein K458DRAFT_20718 [Lentithecium fluviatile CBS 122367]